jgi:hypothetical protein
VSDGPIVTERPRTTGDSRAAPAHALALVDAASLAVVGLSAVQPFAAYMQTNASKLVRPGEVIRLAVLWLVLTLAAFVGVRLLTRRTPAFTIAVAFVVVELSFWNYWHWFPTEPPDATTRVVALAIWAALTALLARVAMMVAAWKPLRAVLVVFLTVWTLGSVVGYVADRGTLEGGDAPTVAQLSFPPFESTPDIYWLMLDEHARSDQLERLTDADNSWFMDDLEDRGFSTSSSSHSAYLFTHLSLSSTLAMDYAFTPDHRYKGEIQMAVPFIAGDNPVVETLEDNGYRYIFAPDGSVEWADCAGETADRSCIAPVGGFLSRREPTSLLVRSTPVGSFPLGYVHNDLESVTAGLEQIDDDRPFFLFAHILSPHQPYRYGEGCARRAEPVRGSGYDFERQAAAYANDVECLDHDVVDTVDRIIADDPDAVIIIQSDHGSSLDYDFEVPLDQLTPDMEMERFGALNAIRLPASCRGRSIEGEPIVNTYRLVLACLAGTEPELLDTRTFVSGYGRIDLLDEVQVDDERP